MHSNKRFNTDGLSSSMSKSVAKTRRRLSADRYNANTMEIVMKTIINFSVLIVLIIFSYCSNPSSPEENDRFAIYLLENDSLTTKDVEEVKLSKVILRMKPVISFDDIVSYNFENHKVYLDENPSTYFGTDYITLFSENFGKPFVLIVNCERIYLGSFQPLTSSWLPNTPYVFSFSVIDDENSFIIHRAPCYDESTFIDVRNDKRIFQALGNKIIQ